MKKKDNRQTLHRTTISACLLLFASLVFFIFFFLNHSLKSQFGQLIEDSLSSYTLGQKRQADGIIADLTNNLTGISVIIKTTGLSPSGEWLDLYLKELSNENELYQIEYLTLEQLRAETDSLPAAERNQDTYEALLNGEGTVSDIHYSSSLGGRYVFTVTEPVLEDGRTAGALRADMDASMLAVSYQPNGLFQKTISLLVKSDGTIDYCSTDAYQTDGNLFSTLSDYGLDENTFAQIKQDYQLNDAIVRQFRIKGKSYYISVQKLEYNDWHLVRFVRSPDIMLRSGLIIKSVIAMGSLLVILTALLGIVMFVLFLRQRKMLSLEQQRYAELSQFSDTILFEYDRTSDTLEFTSNAAKLLSLDSLKSSGLSNPKNALPLLHPDDRTVIDALLQNKTSETDDISYTEARLKLRDGSYCWFGCQYKVVSRSGRSQTVIGKLVNISSQRGREQSLLLQARQDVLTRLYNKSGEQLIENLLLADSRGILFMIDLDNFKAINDTCGHAAGDALLTKIGGILRDIFRTEDILARIGGDEFIAYIPGQSNPIPAQRKAQRILEQVHCLKACPGSALHVSASIGIAVSPLAGSTYSELYQAADRAMYLIKQEKKGGYSFASGKTWD